ncbi:hypothetical protein L0Y65_00765 [Candidatus Micrarchaeota archaeon]|nr:hypothetical protein [Candidatus Micrarchaeota archaeon]
MVRKDEKVPPYRPPPRRPAIFKSKVLEDIINSKRVGEVWAYLESPAKAEKIREAVVSGLPKVGFRHVESPVSFAAIHGRDPAVLFVDDRTIGCINPERIRKNSPNCTVVLLSERESVCTMPLQHSMLAYPDVAKADLIAAIAGTCSRDFGGVVQAFIHLAEDKLNIESQDENRKRRFAVLVVDDEPRWFSEFLPQLYSIVGRRAGVITKRTYEEAEAFIELRGNEIVCVITDMAFPKGGKVTGEAGRALVGYAHDCFPRIAKIIASKGHLPGDLQEKALLMAKGSEGSIETLRQFMLDYAGFGEFIMPVHGKRMRISSIAGLRSAIEMADMRDLEEFGAKDFFSTWLYMHGFHDAGDRIRPSRFGGEWLRGFLMGELEYEMGQLKNDPFVINDGQGQEVCRTHSLAEIANQIRSMPAELIEKWGEDDDFLSFWLMRHGYSGLADEVRPICGKGDEIRARVVAAFAKWIGTYENGE